LKRTKEEAEQTKKSLINIALREIVKNGFENITLEKVAAEAGVTRGAIYWHFKNKEDLLDSIITVKDLESIELMKNIFTSETPALDRLYDLTLANFPDIRKINEAVHYTKLKTDFYFYYHKHGDSRKLGKTFVKYTSFLLKEGKQEGTIKKNINTDEAAHLIYSLIGGLILRFSVNPGKFKTMSSIRNILKNYIKQLET
jgi:TetR/AcrR family acrAB operon transcriptional repressor